jgi:DNA-binding XRE family transcriptional regulator
MLRGMRVPERELGQAERFALRLGRAIGFRREVLKMTQEQLGKEVGLSRTAIVNIEAGRQGIGLYRVEDFCTALAVTHTWMCTAGRAS